MTEIGLLVVRGEMLSSETVRRSVASLSPEEREGFSRMADPVAADVRAVLRAEANRFRRAGEAVSVAHAGRFGVLAHAKARSREEGGEFALGVDCEPWTEMVPEPGVVRDVTSPEEFARWSALPEKERGRAFTRLWTLKEAAFKAGAGPMREARVSADFLKHARPDAFRCSPGSLRIRPWRWSREAGRADFGCRSGIRRPFDFQAAGRAVTVPANPFHENVP